jgi:putative transposase
MLAASAEWPEISPPRWPGITLALTRLSAADLCRKHGISDATFYNWRSKYGGMEASEAKRLKALEDENKKLKKLLAESMLDLSTLKELLGKNF